MREAVRTVAESLDLPQYWRNDAAKAFLHERARFEKWREWPSLEVVLAYFPPERLPVRAQLLLEEMFDDRG